MNAAETARHTAATLRAYERWAPNYPPVAHNPLMRAEQQAMAEWWPDVRGRRALDLACGSGRYTKLMRDAGAAQVISLDFCPAMLRQVAGRSRVCASMMRLPFRDRAFRAVVSGLAVGHAADVRVWMSEIGRVLASGGILLYSDFHPAAARAGMKRTYRDRGGASATVPHRLHDVAAQLDAAIGASLRIEAVRELRIGVDLQTFARASDGPHDAWDGLPVVLIVRARKD